jgi:hypothetical protein
MLYAVPTARNNAQTLVGRVIMDHEPKDSNREGLKETTSFLGDYLFWCWSSTLHPIGTFVPFLLFRSQARDEKAWPLLGKLARKFAPLFGHIQEESHRRVIGEQIRQSETEVIGQFRRQFDLKDWTEIEVLSYARHHGAPTTLLDWTTNPLFALWFSISDESSDNESGVVFALDYMKRTEDGLSESGIVASMNCPTEAEDKCNHIAHTFLCPQKIDRSHRQSSVFSKANYAYSLIPFDELPGADKLLRRFDIPARQKPNLRRLLSSLGLTPFAMYGDPDSFGKTIEMRFEFPKARTRRE